MNIILKALIENSALIWYNGLSQIREYTFEAVFISWMGIGLTHWGRVTHICVSNLTIIGSDNGLSPERRQAII